MGLWALKDNIVRSASTWRVAMKKRAILEKVAGFGHSDMDFPGEEGMDYERWLTLSECEPFLVSLNLGKAHISPDWHSSAGLRKNQRHVFCTLKCGWAPKCREVVLEHCSQLENRRWGRLRSCLRGISERSTSSRDRGNSIKVNKAPFNSLLMCSRYTWEQQFLERSNISEKFDKTVGDFRRTLKCKVTFWLVTSKVKV